MTLYIARRELTPNIHKNAIINTHKHMCEHDAWMCGVYRDWPVAVDDALHACCTNWQLHDTNSTFSTNSTAREPKTRTILRAEPLSKFKQLET